MISANIHPIGVDRFTLNCQNTPDFMGTAPVEFV